MAQSKAMHSELTSTWKDVQRSVGLLGGVADSSIFAALAQEDADAVTLRDWHDALKKMNASGAGGAESCAFASDGGKRALRLALGTAWRDGALGAASGQVQALAGLVEMLMERLENEEVPATELELQGIKESFMQTRDAIALAAGSASGVAEALEKRLLPLACASGGAVGLGAGSAADLDAAIRAKEAELATVGAEVQMLDDALLANAKAPQKAKTISFLQSSLSHATPHRHQPTSLRGAPPLRQPDGKMADMLALRKAMLFEQCSLVGHEVNGASTSSPLSLMETRKPGMPAVKCGDADGPCTCSSDEILLEQMLLEPEDALGDIRQSCCPASSLECSGCAHFKYGACHECQQGFMMTASGTCTACMDIAGWVDRDHHTCQTYGGSVPSFAAQKALLSCSSEAATMLAHKGLTAKDACCACGGGVPAGSPFVYAVQPAVLGGAVSGRPEPRTASSYSVDSECPLAQFGLKFDGETGQLSGTAQGLEPFTVACVVTAYQSNTVMFNATLNLIVNVAFSYPPRVVFGNGAPNSVEPTMPAEAKLLRYGLRCSPDLPWLSVDKSTGKITYAKPSSGDVGMASMTSEMEFAARGGTCYVNAATTRGEIVRGASFVALAPAYHEKVSYDPRARDNLVVARVLLTAGEAVPAIDPVVLGDKDAKATMPAMFQLQCYAVDNDFAYDSLTGIAYVNGEEVFTFDPLKGILGGKVSSNLFFSATTKKQRAGVMLVREHVHVECKVLGRGLATPGDAAPVVASASLQLKIADRTCWSEQKVVSDSIFLDSVAPLIVEDEIECRQRCDREPDCSHYLYKVDKAAGGMKGVASCSLSTARTTDFEEDDFEDEEEDEGEEEDDTEEGATEEDGETDSEGDSDDESSKKKNKKKNKKNKKNKNTDTSSDETTESDTSSKKKKNKKNDASTTDTTSTKKKNKKNQASSKSSKSSKKSSSKKKKSKKGNDPCKKQCKKKKSKQCKQCKRENKNKKPKVAKLLQVARKIKREQLSKSKREHMKNSQEKKPPRDHKHRSSAVDRAFAEYKKQRKQSLGESLPANGKHAPVSENAALNLTEASLLQKIHDVRSRIQAGVQRDERGALKSPWVKDFVPENAATAFSGQRAPGPNAVHRERLLASMRSSSGLASLHNATQSTKFSEDAYKQVKRFIEAAQALGKQLETTMACLEALPQEQYHMDYIIQFGIDRFSNPVKLVKEGADIYIDPLIDGTRRWLQKQNVGGLQTVETQLNKAVADGEKVKPNINYGLEDFFMGVADQMFDAVSELTQEEGMEPSKCLFDNLIAPAYDTMKPMMAKVMSMFVQPMADIWMSVMGDILLMVSENILAVAENQPWYQMLHEVANDAAASNCMDNLDIINARIQMFADQSAFPKSYPNLRQDLSALLTELETPQDHVESVIGVVQRAAAQIMAWSENSFVMPLFKSVLTMMQSGTGVILHVVDAIAGLIPEVGALLSASLTGSVTKAVGLVVNALYEEGSILISSKFAQALKTILDSVRTIMDPTADMGTIMTGPMFPLVMVMRKMAQGFIENTKDTLRRCDKDRGNKAAILRMIATSRGFELPSPAPTPATPMPTKKPTVAPRTCRVAPGLYGNNVCPGSSRPMSAEECKGIIGDFPGNLPKTGYGTARGKAKPKGCFASKRMGEINFNPDADGGGDPDSRPLCMICPTAEPTPAPTPKPELCKDPAVHETSATDQILNSMPSTMVEHNGESCMEQCGKAGDCDWCGPGGACCGGLDTDPLECQKSVGESTTDHVCVKVAEEQWQTLHGQLPPGCQPEVLLQGGCCQPAR
eukprot:TRINITY_DN720_c1_g1_i1.p1 TRINITY_DN720_c1_g1~~TRINITY_DN720_c1_g1_i1.p1  ORF type:complete len:1908 (-),score=502.16 TRINITY_DN720_c1_g1_i1:1172-6550(-)